MNALLTELGIPDQLQAFFNINDLRFFYGVDEEYFGKGFHRVPTTGNLWRAGNGMGREVIITSSVMEAIALVTLNRSRYANPGLLSFIAIGNLPHTAQMDWIRINYPNRKFTLAFGNSLLGRLTDIVVGAGLRMHAPRITNTNGGVTISLNLKTFYLEYDAISLNRFERAASIRTRIRTLKPRSFETYLDQLKFYANQ